MFRKFEYKILLLPVVAIGLMVLICAIQFLLNRNNAELLKQIEKGYAPALEMSRNQLETLTAIQHELQDAVASEIEES
jgi:hypothetical protein